ncbi:urease accessory protein [Roseivivax lentus]|uniref:Urease accessory protein UreF n=1 Tax=Roseivivax lentus TaxID=633194 RepID=A0A1N7P0A0_9RHOB|nr:urease accessory protein UreF [Roseivivax lentus]SIT03966.1 urease accessory protein [Roseivivax lentus]
MTTDTDLLILAQWLSPAYPLGAFAWSQGLEMAVADGHVTDAATLRDWVADTLEHGAGRSDAILIRLGHACEADALARLNETALAFAPSQERRLEMTRQGTAFCKTTAATSRIDLPDMVLPVALGRAARLTGLDLDLTVALYLQSQVSNLVSAAQRLMALGQTEGQGVVAGLRPLCRTIAEATRGAGEDDLYSAAYLADIASMRHETLQPRLFQS